MDTGLLFCFHRSDMKKIFLLFLFKACYTFDIHLTFSNDQKELILTLPTVIADTQLLPGEVAVAVVGAAAIVPAVRDVTGLTFPVFVTFTVDSAGSRVPWGALPMARAVIGAGVDPGKKQN